MRSGFLAVDGIRVHHVHGGGGPPVLFVHGLGSAGYLEWRFNLPTIARRHAVHAPDLPGFGQSDRPRDGYGIPLFARVIEEYIDQHGLERPVLVGASMGGRVLMEVALRRPERVSKLVLVNALGVVRPNVQPFYSFLLLPGVGEGIVGAMGEALRRVPARTIRRCGRLLGVAGDPERVLDDSYLADLRELHASAGYPRVYAETVRSLVNRESLATAALVDRLAATGLPMLLIWGEGDRLLPAARVRLAHRRLPGARLVIVEGANHVPQAEQPEAFNRALEEFLDG